MEFGSGFSISEEEHMSKGQLPVSYSTSSSPSSSSSQCKAHLVPSAQIYANQNQHHHHQLGGSWLGTAKYDPEQEEDISRSRMNDMGAGAAKIELMDVNDEDSAAAAAGNNVIEMEHMFDKVVTPSDVGKLNRLVIPKQHAEKYFPLDSSSNEKGLLLNFEDTSGKAWRFRYSYWNSSQSYVMTKGWSRFVKEKKLDAGDIVSFQRGVGESGKYHLYIDWRRRPDAPHQNYHNHRHQQQQYHHYSSIPWSPLLKRPPTGIVPMMPIRDHLYSSSNTSRSNAYGSSYGYNYNSSSSSSNSSNAGANPCSSSGTIVYMRSGAAPQQVGMGMVKWQQGGGGGIMEPMVYESVPLVQGKAAAKRLRLFGVNMDCPITDSQEYHKLSSPATPMHHHHHHHPSMALQQQQQPPQLSPSLPSHHCLQLRLYNGSRLQPSMPNTTQFLHKGKSSMSLNLDI